MSPRSWKERVEDILDAIAEIQAFTQQMSYEKFQEDVKTIKAVALNFVIIGEAAGHVPEDVATVYQEIPWEIMRAMRNQLVHIYFSVDPQIVWDTVQNDLPPLVDPLKKLLETE